MTRPRALVVDADRGRAEAFCHELGAVGIAAAAAPTLEGVDVQAAGEYVLSPVPSEGESPVHPYYLCNRALALWESRLQPEMCLSRPLCPAQFASCSADRVLAGEQIYDLCRVSLLGGVNSALGYEPFVSALCRAFRVSGCLLAATSGAAPTAVSARHLSPNDQNRVVTASDIAARARVTTLTTLEDNSVVSVCAMPVESRERSGRLALFEYGNHRFANEELRVLEAVASRVQHELHFLHQRARGVVTVAPTRRRKNSSKSPEDWAKASTMVQDASPEPGHTPVSPGATLGGYRILSKISVGAMGTVYRGEDVTLGRPVAVKVLRPTLAKDRELAKRFHKEARILAALRHPNLVHIYSFGVEHGLIYFIMELVEGMAVSDLINRSNEAGEQIDVNVVTAVVEEIADALDEIHTAGIIHRDVKPENVLLDRINGRAVLVDVGVAKGEDDEDFIAGTPGFTPPECFHEGAETSATDVYSLAATCYAMLTGATPFPGADITEVIGHQMHTPPERPSSLRPDLSSAVDVVLLKALKPDQDLRYTSASAFAIGLAKALSRPASSRPGS